VSDDRGRILAQQDATYVNIGTLLATAPVRHAGTFYSRWGDWFAWLNVAGLVAILSSLLHFDDRMNEFCTRSFRAGLPTAIRREQYAVLLLAQGFVKAKQRRRLQNDCGTEQTSGTYQERHQASEDAVRRAQIGRALPGAIHNQ